jgi:hypothetical protein
MLCPSANTDCVQTKAAPDLCLYMKEREFMTVIPRFPYFAHISSSCDSACATEDQQAFSAESGLDWDLSGVGL